jgi:transposase
MVIDGAMNGAAFTTYAEAFLAPTLSPGDIVVLDNLPAHKVNGARAAIERAGARLIFLPPYSPDFNPIDRPSPRSRRSCERRRRGRWKLSTPPSPPRSTPSHLTNAQTTSPTPATSRIDPKML